MTPKVAQFLAEQQPATPCLVLDVDRVEANFRALAARPAAGANLLRGEGQSGARRCWSGWSRLGVEFRCGELSRRSPPAWTPAPRPEAISFGNTIKKVSAIRSRICSAA